MAVAALLLTAPQAFASRTASTRPELLPGRALEPPATTAALGPAYVPQGFELQANTDLHPASFALFPEPAPVPERLEPEKLASGVASWELTPNLQRIQIFVCDSWQVRENLGPVDSPNLYQAFGLDPQNNTDPMGLLGPNTDVNYDPAALALQETQRAAALAQAAKERLVRQEQERRQRQEEAARIAELAVRIQRQRVECGETPCMSAGPSDAEKQRVAVLWDTYWTKVRRDAVPVIVTREVPNAIAIALAGRAAPKLFQQRAQVESTAVSPGAPRYLEVTEQPPPVTSSGVSRSEYATLRRGSPNQQRRDDVNPVGPKVDPVSGFTVDRLEADRIVPMWEVVQMPGFSRLSLEAKLEVLNLPQNFMGLSKPSNASKGARSWARWTGHSALGPVPPSVRTQMLEAEAAARAALQAAILERAGR